MKTMLPLLLAFLLVLSGCGQAPADSAYQQISQERAKEMMDTQQVLVLDVREQAEYVPENAGFWEGLRPAHTLLSVVGKLSPAAGIPSDVPVTGPYPGPDGIPHKSQGIRQIVRIP